MLVCIGRHRRLCPVCHSRPYGTKNGGNWRVAHPETFAVAVASRREQPRAVTVQSQAVASVAVAVVSRHEHSQASPSRAVASCRGQSRASRALEHFRGEAIAVASGREQSRTDEVFSERRGHRRVHLRASRAVTSVAGAVTSSHGQSRGSLRQLRAVASSRGQSSCSRKQSRASRSLSRDVASIRREQ